VGKALFWSSGYPCCCSLGVNGGRVFFISEIYIVLNLHLMKTNYYGILVLILGIWLSAYTRPVKKTATIATMNYIGDRITEANVEDPSNWIEGAPAFGCEATAEECVCTIEVDTKYTHPEGWANAQKFNTTDPDGNGPELAFPSIIAINGVIMNGVQYKMLSSSMNITGSIEIKNGTVQ
jgi:hypothetical protein